jgi:hypothetical protein
MHLLPEIKTKVRENKLLGHSPMYSKMGCYKRSKGFTPDCFREFKVCMTKMIDKKTRKFSLFMGG